MGRIGFLLVVLVLFFSFDWYAFSGISLIFEKNQWITYSYWLVSVVVLIGFYKAYLDFVKREVNAIRAISTNLLMGFGFAVVVWKIVFVSLLLVQDALLLLFDLLSVIISSISDISFEDASRSPMIVATFALLASIPFFSMLYGITLGKYKFEVEKIKLKFNDLPKSFHGFKILQISDIHAGSFDSLKQVQKGIDLIMAQNADLIVFTGDLVNTLKEEIDPYINAFSALSAPFGMFSILGNHDYYGMYQVAQKDPVARKIYMDDFDKKQEAMGFRLLNNESVKIEKSGESIRLIGVENWGAGPFPKKGDLEIALQDVEHDEFSILLSHDPSHWDHHVLPHPKHIHLTLSGHTHGMQFGIKLPKFQWSPVKYRYKRWMGLYEKAGKYLYVNRGFGFLAWPGRVGMSPEITLFELSKTKAKRSDHLK